jgi:hypothetical protein
MLHQVHFHQWGNICHGLHLNVATVIGEYLLMYSLSIWHYGMILKLALTTITKVVAWAKAKRHTTWEDVCVNFLKQDFEWTQEWLWYLNNVKINTIESTLKVFDFESRTGNGSGALMRFSILVHYYQSGRNLLA